MPDETFKGKRSAAARSASSWAASRRQWGQNLLPTNIMPKQEAHSTVAGWVPQ
jgi:hypothetical protein